MPAVTDADRQTAERIVATFMPPPTNFVAQVAYDDRHPIAVNAIAAALAEQRERHVADLERIQRQLDGRRFMDGHSKTADELAEPLVEFCRERIAELKGEHPSR